MPILKNSWTSCSRKYGSYRNYRNYRSVENGAVRLFKGAGAPFPTHPHHSDRGSQYCSDIYVKLLQDENINISMTESGDPLENAVAERLNGIIKEEYLNDHIVDTIEQAKKLLDNAVSLYNQQRPHQSIGYLTPEYVHQNKTKTEKLWKNYYQKNSNIVNPLQDLNITVNI